MCCGETPAPFTGLWEEARGKGDGGEWACLLREAGAAAPQALQWPIAPASRAV
ncbi:hypothetical protein P7K49_012052, partial [Saguinus oedipus]